MFGSHQNYPAVVCRVWRATFSLLVLRANKFITPALFFAFRLENIGKENLKRGTPDIFTGFHLFP